MSSWARRRWSTAVAILFVIVAALFAFFAVRSQLQEPATIIVYLKDVPYCSFLGHVVQSQDRIRLVEEYPLWDDDWRDGIWSVRLWESPMEKIKFAFETRSSDRHGIVLYSYDRKWRKQRPATWSITWFDSRDAVRRGGPGKLLWDLRQSRTDFLSSDKARKLGIKEVTECDVEIAQVDARNAAVASRANAAWDAARTTDTLGVLGATVGGPASLGPAPLMTGAILTASLSPRPSVVLMPPIGGLEFYRRGHPPLVTSGR
jgi:hypothetical protein